MTARGVAFLGCASTRSLVGSGTSASKKGRDASLSIKRRGGDKLMSVELAISVRRTAVEGGEGEVVEGAFERGSGESGRVRVRGSELV